MKAANRIVELALSADALKLLVVIGVFLWPALLLSSKGAVLDFSAFYTAGGVILEGHRHQLFDLPIQTEFQHRVLSMSGPLPFFHLAYESLIFVPLALLPFKVALWLWRLLSVAMLLASAYSLADTFRGARTHVLILSLASYPVALAIVQGQDSILLLLLISASLAALMRGQKRLAGLLLACALFKPHLVLPIAAILIWKQGRRFLEGFLGGGLAVFALSIGITGAKGLLQMAELMRYAVSVNGYQIGANAQSMPNLRGLCTLLGFSAGTSGILTAVLSALLFILVAWRLRNQHSPTLLYPPLVTLALLTSIHVNAHDLALLLIPVLAMLAQNSKPASICAAACFCMPLFWFSRHSTLFFFVLCAVLLLTLKQTTARVHAATPPTPVY
jgi:hypothetical protein